MAIKRYAGNSAASQNGSSGSFDVTLSPAVDMTRAFPVEVQCLPPSGYGGYTWNFRWELVNATTFRFYWSSQSSISGNVPYSFAIIDDPLPAGAGRTK